MSNKDEGTLTGGPLIFAVPGSLLLKNWLPNFRLGEDPLLDLLILRDFFVRVGIFIGSSAFFQFQIATVTEKGVEIEGPLSAETNWEIAHMIR